MSHEVRAGAATRPWRCEMSGFTAVPRWTLNPVPGIGEHEVRIPDELTAASHRLANDSALPLSSVLLTAHAKVLGALSGDRKSTRLNSSHDQISYAVFCLKKKKEITHSALQRRGIAVKPRTPPSERDACGKQVRARQQHRTARDTARRSFYRTQRPHDDPA